MNAYKIHIVEVILKTIKKVL